MQATDDTAGKALQDGLDDPTAILVAVDTSGQALKVVEAAARLSRGAPSATVHVLHVFRSNRLDQQRAGTAMSNAEVVEEAKDYLAYHVKAVEKRTRSKVLGHFVMGEPVAEILKMRETLKAEFLVVGTHDATGFERLLLGSIAETLMRKAACTVMVVR
jgi:nucleotide-binding universal stress UspA family protein